MFTSSGFSSLILKSPATTTSSFMTEILSSKSENSLKKVFVMTPVLYITTIEQLYEPDVIRPPTNSNVVGETFILSGFNRNPGTARMATPPWLQESDSCRALGRGWSTTAKPSERRRLKNTESTSCHVSVRRRMSTPLSVHRLQRSSILLLTDLMLSSPKLAFFVIGREWR